MTEDMRAAAAGTGPHRQESNFVGRPLACVRSSGSAASCESPNLSHTTGGVSKSAAVTSLWEELPAELGGRGRPFEVTNADLKYYICGHDATRLPTEVKYVIT